MASSIQLLRSLIARERPFTGNLLEGQPAVNLNVEEPGLFFKTSDGSMVKMGPAYISNDGLPPNSSPAGSAGNSRGEIWIDASLDPPTFKIFDGVDWIAVTGSIIPDGSVTEAKLGSGSVTEAKLGSDSVTTVKLDDAAVTESKLAPEAVTSSKIATDAVTDAKVAPDAAIDSEKLSYIPPLTGTVSRTVEGKLADFVSVKDFGAVGDGDHNDTEAIQKALNTAKPVRIPVGTYKITSPLRAYNSILGESPTGSVLHNYVTTPNGQVVPEACLDVSGANYYSLFQNFAVEGKTGNSSSGITTRTQQDVDDDTNDNPSYCHWDNVYSYNNAVDGFYLRRAWANSFNMCKFHYNGRWGFNIDNQTAPPAVDEDSATNGCLMVNCEFRHNGPVGSSSAPGSQLGGGLKVAGAAGLWVQGGIIESNQIVGVEIIFLGQSTRAVGFSNIYTEFNGYSQNSGATFYIGANVSNVYIRDNWLSYGAQTAGHTNYLIYNAGTAKVYYENNFTSTVGAGTPSLLFGKTNLEPDEVASKTSKWFGDPDQSGGDPTNTVILTATANGQWMVSGFLHFRRNSDQTGGIYPFVAAYDSLVGRFANIGASVVSGSTASPTIAFSGDDLQITTPGYCYAYVFGVQEQILSAPTTFSWNTTIFPNSAMRRA